MNNREAMIEMMRDYQQKGVGFFTNTEEVLDVEIISSLGKTLLGCLLTLTS